MTSTQRANAEQALWAYDQMNALIPAVARDGPMEVFAEIVREHLADPAPLDMVLPCPRCGMLHVDAPEPATGWENPPHRSHKCHGCGLIWRPADVPTNGVEAVKTRGEKDSPTDDAEPVDPDWLLAVGASGGNDEPDVDVYDIKAGGRLIVRVVIQFRRGEITASSVGLSWTSTFGTHKVSLAYTIDDDPTRGTVRRLCTALGIPLRTP